MKNFSNVSFSLIGFLYITIAGALCHILSIPEIVKGFLALPAFLIIPYLVGNASFYGIKHFLKIDDIMNKISKFIMYWCIGTIIITLMAMFLESVDMFNIYSYIIFLGVLSMYGIIKDMSKTKLNNNNKTSFKNNFYTIRHLFPLLLCVLIGIIPAIFITYFSPFPFIYGIDVFIWSYISEIVIKYGHFFLSGAYFPTFAIYGAIMEIIFGMMPNQMPIFWAARFLTYPLYSFGIYLFLYKLSKNDKLALLGSLIAVWFTVYNPPFIDIVLYYFTPKIVVWVLFPFLLYLIYTSLMNEKNMQKFKTKDGILLLVIPMVYISILFLANYSMPAIYNIYGYIVCFTTLGYFFVLKCVRDTQLKKKIFILIVASSAIFFLHIPMGILAVIIILVWVFVRIFIVPSEAKNFSIVWLFVLCIILYLLLRFYNVVQFPMINLRYTIDPRNISPPTGDFHYLFNLITTSYIPLLIVFFCLGIMLAIIFNKHRPLNYSLAFTVFFIIFVYFLPIGFMERVLPFLIPFLVYFMVFGIIGIGKIMVWKRKLFNILFFILPITIVVIGIIAPYIHLINKIIPPESSYYPYFTFYSKEEYDTYNSFFNSIKNNDVKTIIISDLHTKYVILGMSQNDMFAMTIELQTFVEQYEMDIFWTNNSKDAYEKINFLLSNKTFTCFWYHVSPWRCDNLQPRAMVVVHPRTEGSFKGLYPNRKDFKVNVEKFFDSTYFTSLYNDGKIYIFGVNPEPGIPFKL